VQTIFFLESFAWQQKNTRLPSHVPESLYRDFDIYAPPGFEDDYHLALKRAHALCPDIFWSPYQGGHWVAIRGEDIYHMFKDYEYFSNEVGTVPKEERSSLRLLPKESDPPLHTVYRSLINPWFTPKAVGDLEKQARVITTQLIDGFIGRGECDFVTEFSQHLPMAIFMRLVDLPYEDREYLMGLVEPLVYRNEHSSRETTEASITKLRDYLERVLKKRAAHPGNDMLSRMATASRDGKPLSMDEQLGMAILVTAGGLDTVASMIGFIARFLADNPQHRRQLVADPDLIPGAVEELIRRHGVANPSRLITKDFVYKGIQFKAGEQITLSAPLHGLDDRVFENPMTVDFARKVGQHSIFGNGPHRCPGSFLARTEIKVFLQEWLQRIPEFSVRPGAKPGIRSGVNGSLYSLPLVWQVA
jgi:cytochrome P450